jgi:hypothetical protein
VAVHAGRALFEQGIGDSRGNAQRGVLLPVYLRDTDTLATLYTDRTKSMVADNPISTNGLGNVAIFADPGDYETVVNGAPLYFTVVPDWEDIVITGEAEAGLPAHLADAVDAHDASAISVVPIATLTGATAQAALEALAARLAIVEAKIDDPEGWTVS